MSSQPEPTYEPVVNEGALGSKRNSFNMFGNMREQWVPRLHIPMTVIHPLLAMLLLHWRDPSMRPKQVFERIMSWIWSAITAPCGIHHVWYWLFSLVMVLALLLAGTRSGFLLPGRPPEGRSPCAILRTLFVTLLVPGLAEELWFRAVLLPQGVEAKQVIAQVVINQIAFLCYHLDTFHTQRVFGDWRFLLLAALLGLACTFAYLATQGSVWPSAIIHWLCVWIWLNFMGGEDRVLGIWHGDPELSNTIAGYNEGKVEEGLIDDWFVDRKNDILWVSPSERVPNVDVFYEEIIRSLGALRHMMPYRAIAVDEIPRSAGKVDKMELDRRKEEYEAPVPHIPRDSSTSSTISTQTHATCDF
jgi:membrane protease YdiL (CAAX protease family)